MPHKIMPFIRAVDNGQALAQYYVDTFNSVGLPGNQITKSNPFVTSFELLGQSMATLMGGQNPGAALTPAISFSLRITSADATKALWDKLSEGGKILMEFNAYPRSKAYGRCSDKNGVSWQIMYDDSEGHTENKLIPSLLFTGANAGKAEEAMNLYTSLFPASKINHVFRYGDQGMLTPESLDKPEHVAHGEFELVNQLFIAMDSSMDHKFSFTDGVSLSVSCKDQEEVDHYRNALIADGGQESQCGWLKDKYGVARQIVPVQLDSLLFQADQEKAQYAMQAMLKMKKIVLADLTE